MARGDDDTPKGKPTKRAATRKRAAKKAAPRARKATTKRQGAEVRRLHSIPGEGNTGGAPATTAPPRRANQFGRPRLLNDEVQKAIVGAIAVGATMQEAAAVAGITEQCLHNWKSRGRKALEALDLDPDMALDADLVLSRIPEMEHAFVEFLWAIESAIPQRNIQWLSAIHRHPDWRSKAWLLEKNERVKQDGLSVNVEIEVHDPQAALRERLERLRPGAIDAVSWEDDEAEEA